MRKVRIDGLSRFIDIMEPISENEQEIYATKCSESSQSHHVDPKVLNSSPLSLEIESVSVHMNVDDSIFIKGPLESDRAYPNSGQIGPTMHQHIVALNHHRKTSRYRIPDAFFQPPFR